MVMGIESFSVEEHETTANSVEFTQKMNSLKKRMESDKSTEEELQKVAKEFEAIFIGQIWKQMKESIPKEGYMKSKQEDSYMAMFDQEFSEHLAEGGGIGLQEMLYTQLKQNLENAGTPSRGFGDSKDLPSLRDDKNLTPFADANKLSPIGKEEENNAESFGFTPVENTEDTVYSMNNTGSLSENGKTNDSQNFAIPNTATQQNILQNKSAANNTISNNPTLNETIRLNKRL